MSKKKSDLQEQGNPSKKCKINKLLNGKEEIDEENEESSDLTAAKTLRTLSIAVPGSIMLNAQSNELQTYLAGQIARAACIYKVDEIIIYNDVFAEPVDEVLPLVGEMWEGCLKLGRILQYLECPQYLRKIIFPVHKHLEFVGVLNPLDAPHHCRAEDDALFREGVVTSKATKINSGSYVNVGLAQDVLIDKILAPNVRVTVKMLPKSEKSKKLKGKAVPPNQPKAELGLYWGYNLRLAKSLTQIFSECPYDGGYDLTIGTSDKGIPHTNLKFDNFAHCLIAFGGVEGLESIIETDQSLYSDIRDLFDFYVNTCPNQGSRTIRTEEAILISLSVISNKLQ